MPEDEAIKLILTVPSLANAPLLLILIGILINSSSLSFSSYAWKFFVLPIRLQLFPCGTFLCPSFHSLTNLSRQPFRSCFPCFHSTFCTCKSLTLCKKQNLFDLVTNAMGSIYYFAVNISLKQSPLFPLNAQRKWVKAEALPINLPVFEEGLWPVEARFTFVALQVYLVKSTDCWTCSLSLSPLLEYS